MAAPRSTAWQRAARWILTAMTSALFFFYGARNDVPEPPAEGDSKRIRIEHMRPLELSPGGALVVRFSSSDSDGPPVTVTVDGESTEVLRQRAGVVVVRVPATLQEGRAKVRVHQGEQRSKKRDVWLRPLSMTKVVQLGVLGIALLVLGMRTLSRGIRTYAGNRLRQALDKIGAGVWRSALAGMLLGAATQSTTASAGVLVGLLGARLVNRDSALAALLGAQLGACAVAVLLPLGTDAAVMLVALGVIWVSLSDSRRARALAKMLLGLGLLLFGFETMRVGFQPLVASPESLHPLSSGISVVDTAGAALLGALMTTLLQGPGPPLVLVLGLVESTETASIHAGLHILAGVPLGVSASAALVAWPFGGSPRKWAKSLLTVGAIGTIGLTLSASLWPALVDPLIPGDPELVGAQAVLLPAAAPHFVASFLLALTATSAVLVAGLPRLRRWVENVGDPRSTGAPLRSTVEPGKQLQACLAPLEKASAHIHRIWRHGERGNAQGAEAELARAGQELSELLQSLRNDDTAQSTAVFSAAMALLVARDDLIALQHLTERGVEKGLSPAGNETAALERLRASVNTSLSALIQGADAPATGDWESAREREIWLNAADSQLRTQLQHHRAELGLSYLQHWSAVSAAYEQLGNQLFRAADALWGDADD